jgi:hypothetical protein
MADDIYLIDSHVFVMAKNRYTRLEHSSLKVERLLSIVSFYNAHVVQ